MKFGDLVEYENKSWRYVGMTEDYEETLVRQEDSEHVYLEFVFYDDWHRIKILKKSEIKKPFPNVNKSFTEEFCNKNGLDKKEFIKELCKKKSKKK